MQRMRAERLPVMIWGSAAWHMRQEVIGVVGQVLARMTELILHTFHQEGESWCARERLTTALGNQPVAVGGELLVRRGGS